MGEHKSVALMEKVGWGHRSSGTLSSLIECVLSRVLIFSYFISKKRGRGYIFFLPLPSTPDVTQLGGETYQTVSFEMRRGLKVPLFCVG